MLVYFLVIRHKKRAKKQLREKSSPSIDYFADPKFPISAQKGTTIAASQSNDPRTRDGPFSGSPPSFSPIKEKPSSYTKTTTVAWDPSQPPKAPRLSSWLKVQDKVSPFGPIKLPTDTNNTAPLGGQLKSPLQRVVSPVKSPRMTSGIPVARGAPSPHFRSMIEGKPTIAPVPRSPLILPVNTKQQENLPRHSVPDQLYRESKASVWTDEVPYEPPSPPLQSPPNKKNSINIIPASSSKDYGMSLPSPRAPFRTTAEWFASRESTDSANISTANIGIGMKARPAFGLPRNPKLSANNRFPRPGQRNVRSVEGDVQGLGKFLAKGDRLSAISRGTSGSGGSSQPTPGVGKAV